MKMLAAEIFIFISLHVLIIIIFNYIFINFTFMRTPIYSRC